MAAIGRVLLMDKGAYNGSTVYNQLDWVRDNGAAWVCKVDGTVGITPVEGANWTLMAQDGSVSGAVDWSTGVNNKPFETVDTTTDFEVDANNELQIKRDTFGVVRVKNGATVTDLEASGDSIVQIEAGNNVTISADDTTNPKKLVINSTGGGGGSSTFAGLDDTDISSPQDNQIVQYATVSGNKKLQNVTMDASPTQSSAKPVTSGGVYTALSGKADTADLDSWVATASVSSGSVSFSGIDDSGNYGYEVFFNITSGSTNKNPTAQLSSISGEGTSSMSLTFTTDADNGTNNAKLRRIK